MLIVTKGLPTFILLGFSLDGQNFSGHLYKIWLNIDGHRLDISFASFGHVPYN